MTAYKIIEIFTSEAIRWEGKSLSDAIVEYVRGKKIAARCMVTRAIEGCYENGDIASTRLEILSLNMPLRITIVLPSAQAESVLPGSRKWSRMASLPYRIFRHCFTEPKDS